jgi:hypothetical protein
VFGHYPASFRTPHKRTQTSKQQQQREPKEVYAECAHHGEEKAKFGTVKLLTLSVIAGWCVNWGEGGSVRSAAYISFVPTKIMTHATLIPLP